MPFINRLRLLKNYLSQATFGSHGPVEVGIEITNRCNLNCIMCSRQEMTRPIGDISWQLFRRIVDQTCKQAEIYNLYGLGEPLLNPRLFDMIDYCHQKKVPVGISTNVMPLDQQTAEKLMSHPPDHLIFALDAYCRKTYKQIRRGGDFNQVRDNIKYYLKRKQEENAPTFAVLLFVKQKLNQDEVKSFKNYWKNKGVSAIHIKPITEKLNLKIKPNQPGRCLDPWRSFIVTWQGEVHACCLETNGNFKLGNIKKQSFEEIWNGKTWQNLRQSFKNRQLKPLCRSCTLLQPSLLTSIAMSLLPDLVIKKVVPRIRTWPYLLPFLPLWRRSA